MSTFFVNSVEFICVGILPVITFIVIVILAGFLSVAPELFTRNRNMLSIGKIAGFISGLVLFALVALIGSNEIIEGFLRSFLVPGYVGLITAPIMGVAGIVLGWTTISLVEVVIQKRSIAFLIAALAAGGSTSLYLYFTSQAPIRFGLAAGAIGYLLGSLGYIYFKGIEFHNFLFGRQDSGDDDQDWPLRGRNIWY